jgi:hypothetical protein
MTSAVENTGAATPAATAAQVAAKTVSADDAAYALMMHKYAFVFTGNQE